jgi:hypothetical protein
MALAALMTTLLTVLAGTPAQAADLDCADFGSQRAAQLFFLRHGGPQRDPHRLDADSDGVVCETNPAPYYRKRTLPAKPGRPKPAPRPPVVFESSVSLAASHASRIAGERFTLRARVSPAVRRTVVLQGRTTGGSWVKLVKGTTTRKGRLSFVGRASSVDMRYRVKAPAFRDGRKRWTSARSRGRLIDTVPQVVTLEVPGSATPGALLTAVVRAEPARRWRPVALQVWSDGRWRSMVDGVLNRRGVERLPFTRPAGTYELRALVGRYRGARRAASEIDVLTVAAPDTTPAAPTGLTAEAGDAQVALSWDPVTSGGVVEYRVSYRESAGTTWIEAPPVTEPAATVTGLANGVEYTFTVRAVDGDGDPSPESAPATAIPASPGG